MAVSRWSGPGEFGTQKDASPANYTGLGTVVLTKIKAFSYTDITDTVLGVLPAGSYPLRALMDVVTSVNASVVNINIGYQAANVSALVTAGNMKVLGRTELTFTTAGVSVFGTFTSVDTTLTYRVDADTTGATAGSGFIIFQYAQEKIPG